MPRAPPAIQGKPLRGWAGDERRKIPKPSERDARAGRGGTGTIWLAAWDEAAPSSAEFGRGIWGNGMGRDKVVAG